MLYVFLIQACLCVMCFGLRSDAVWSICVLVICYDYVILCLVSSGLRSDAVGKAQVSSGLRSDAVCKDLVSPGLRSDAVSGSRSEAVGKAQYVLYVLLYGLW